MNTKCLVVILLIVTLLFTVSPLIASELAETKLIGVPPGTIIIHFTVDGKNTPLYNENGTPNGIKVGDLVGAADGKPVSVTLIVSDTDDPATAQQNRLFIWSEEGGYELLSSLTVFNKGPEAGLPGIWFVDPPVEPME